MIPTDAALGGVYSATVVDEQQLSATMTVSNVTKWWMLRRPGSRRTPRALTPSWNNASFLPTNQRSDYPGLVTTLTAA